jgi:cell division control protein 7
MSAFQGAPSGVFELQRSNSFRGQQPAKHEYALEQDDAGAPMVDLCQRDSDYEEEEVDESVREDMNKLEDTFPGISDRFRLVNRIGEGTATCCLLNIVKRRVADIRF